MCVKTKDIKNVMVTEVRRRKRRTRMRRKRKRREDEVKDVYGRVQG